jgi:hypothetical protein
MNVPFATETYSAVQEWLLVILTVTDGATYTFADSTTVTGYTAT